MSLYRRPGSRFWWYRFQLDGVTHSRSSGQVDRRQALSVESAAKAAALAQTPRRDPGRGLGVLSTMARQDVRAAIDAGRSPGYVSGLEWCWRNVLDGLGRASLVSQVTSARIVAYAAQREGQGGKGQSVRRELMCLKRVMRRAKAAGWIHAIPDEWPEPKLSPPDPRRAGKLRDSATILRFLAALPNDDARDVYHFAALTGLRWGELLRVEAGWMHPTSAGPVLEIPATAAKLRKARLVTLSASAVEIIQRRADRSPIFPRRGYVKASESACRKIGIEPRITLRDLRHYYATTGLGATSDTTALIHQTGHSRDVMELYQHSTLVRLAAVSQAVAKSLQVEPGQMTNPLPSPQVAQGSDCSHSRYSATITVRCCGNCSEIVRRVAAKCRSGRTGESVQVRAVG